MKTLKLLSALLFVFCFTSITTAQTAEEIIDTYIENMGGLENWNKLEGIKMYAKVNQGGMEIPLEITQLKDGRQMTVINFQGQEIKQGVFDGETLWSTNFASQKAEKSDQETTDNLKLQSGEFPDPFFKYKERGYKVELLGTEEIDGAETFKIKLTRKPMKVDGQEEENVSFYFFDTENFVPIVMHSEIKTGPSKGQMSETKMSDYQEIDGLYFPYALTQGMKGQPGQAITMDKIELNPTVDAKEFKFPDENSVPDTEKKN